LERLLEEDEAMPNPREAAADERKHNAKLREQSKAGANHDILSPEAEALKLRREENEKKIMEFLKKREQLMSIYGAHVKYNSNNSAKTDPLGEKGIIPSGSGPTVSQRMVNDHQALNENGPAIFGKPKRNADYLAPSRNLEKRRQKFNATAAVKSSNKVRAEALQKQTLANDSSTLSVHPGTTRINPDYADYLRGIKERNRVISGQVNKPQINEKFFDDCHNYADFQKKMALSYKLRSMKKDP